MLGAFGWRVAELVQLVGNIYWHDDVKVTFVVVPLEFDPAVQAAGPIGFDFVVGFESVDEMLRVLIAGVFDSEIIDDERENCWARFMFP